MAIGSAVETIVRERDEFASALNMALAQLRYIGNQLHGRTASGDSDALMECLGTGAKKTVDLLADPTACLKAHDEALRKAWGAEAA